MTVLCEESGKKAYHVPVKAGIRTSRVDIADDQSARVGCARRLQTYISRKNGPPEEVSYAVPGITMQAFMVDPLAPE